MDNVTLRKLRRAISYDSLDDLIKLTESHPQAINHKFGGKIDSTLLYAVENLSVQCVQWLLAQGLKPQAQSQNPLTLAITTDRYYGYESDKANTRAQVISSLFEHDASIELENKEQCQHFQGLLANEDYLVGISILSQLEQNGVDFRQLETIADYPNINHLLLVSASLLDEEDYHHSKIQHSIERTIAFYQRQQCINIGQDSHHRSTLSLAMLARQYEFAKQILALDSVYHVVDEQLWFDISASEYEKYSIELLEQVFVQEQSPNRLNGKGIGAPHLAAQSFNKKFLTFFITKGGDINLKDAHGNTPLHIAIEHKTTKCVRWLLLQEDIQTNILNNKGQTALDLAEAQSRLFKDEITLLEKLGAKSAFDLESPDGQIPDPYFHIEALFESGEPWTVTALEAVRDLTKDQQSEMLAIMKLCHKNVSTKPSARWLKTANKHLQVLGLNLFEQQMLIWLPNVKEPRSATPTESQVSSPEMLEYYEHDYLISPNNTILLKGLLWLCGQSSHPQLTKTLRVFAADFYKKVPGIGMRNAKLGNSALQGLSMMPDSSGIKEMVILRASTKYNAALKHINRIFEAVAKERGVSIQSLEELSIPDYGLSDFAKHVELFDDYTATISFDSIGKCSLSWQNDSGKVQKSVPAALTRDFPDRIKALKVMVKELQIATSANAKRIENSFIEQRPISIQAWLEQYIDHKLIGFIGRKLIWSIDTGKQTTAVIYQGTGFIDLEGNSVTLPKEADVLLWHPIQANATDVLAWRNYLIEHQVTQPFKQAHREIYVLTDAEKQTKNHSLRFANHIIRQHQFHALAHQRGWNQTRGGRWDGGDYASATKHLEKHNITVTLDAEGVDELGFDSIYEYVVTEQVSFANNGGVDLADIPPLIFSEVMRDVDLFVGVCSVANDPQWQHREHDYWQAQAAGALSNVANTRKEVLISLIPKLKIAKQLELKERYLHVAGKLTEYKIHLGSGNIMMAPNDRYLCIVQKREINKVMLPFEGDLGLSQILSKALMLCNDNKIKDDTIMSQILQREV